MGQGGERGRGGVMDRMKKGNKEMQEKIGQLQKEKTRYSEMGRGGERGRGGMMDSMKKGNKEMQEKIGQLQREKDQVILFVSNYKSDMTNVTENRTC